jgi:hypothetical protein
MFLEALSVAYAAGLNPYATAALLGLMRRAGWIDQLPAGLDVLQHPWIIGIALALAAAEFVATLVPWVASAWDAAHTFIRPPAAAVLAVATAWHAEPAMLAILALVGGTLGLSTHLTKLGVRLAVDSSPEPVSNGAMNVTELGVIAAVSYFAWNHPLLTLAVALALLIGTVVLVRAVWRTVRRALTGARVDAGTVAR